MMPPGRGEPEREVLEHEAGRWASRWGGALTLLERIPRWAMVLAAAVFVVGGGTVLVTSQISHHHAASQASAGPAMSAACAAAISTQTPAVPPGSRLVIGLVAAPPAYLGAMTPNGNGPWRYWTKTAFGVWGDSPPVTVSVPPGWQQTAAIDREKDGFGTTVRFPTCPPHSMWNFSITGIYLKTPHACLPLDITAAGETARIWVGLGQHCPLTMAKAGTGRSPENYRVGQPRA